jgi:hypothetical protein
MGYWSLSQPGKSSTFDLTHQREFSDASCTTIQTAMDQPQEVESEEKLDQMVESLIQAISNAVKQHTAV